MKHTFYSNGKLLLTSEYLVLDGAAALAIPTKYGQTLTIHSSGENRLNWKSYENNNLWFESVFDLKLQLLYSSNISIAKTLQKILQEAQKLNSSFLNTPKGFDVYTKLDFPRNWGLGTSSTLINNIAQWAGVNAFKLLENSFGGSGYDIACAQNPFPILYSNKRNPPVIKEVTLDWPFKDQLYFVYLNQKQSSKKAIDYYKKINPATEVDAVNTLTKQILKCGALRDFEMLLNTHENLISNILQLPKIKDLLFSDFEGSIKSLGAWGGDFILVTGNTSKAYFKDKGYDIIIPFNEMLLS